jgi:hypothetical protein
LRGEIIAA